jgi:hypothetical protein
MSASSPGTTDTMTVVDASPFPGSVPFRVIVYSAYDLHVPVMTGEIMNVTGISGNIFTVTRGVESTACPAHPVNKIVLGPLTVGNTFQIIQDFFATGSMTDFPVSGTNGRNGHTYWPNDGYVIYRDDGTSTPGWTPWGPIFPLKSPPTTGWSFQNFQAETGSSASSATSSNQNYGNNTRFRSDGQVIVFSTINANENEWRCATRPISGNYDHKFAFIPNYWPGGYSSVGIIQANTTTGVIAFRVFYDSTNAGCSVGITKYTTTGFTPSAAVEYFTVLAGGFISGMVWMRIADDGTTRTYYVSNDGQNWNPIFTVGHTDFITPTVFGIGVNCLNVTNTTGRTGMTLLSMT